MKKKPPIVQMGSNQMLVSDIHSVAEFTRRILIESLIPFALFLISFSTELSGIFLWTVIWIPVQSCYVMNLQNDATYLGISGCTSIICVKGLSQALASADQAQSSRN